MKKYCVRITSHRAFPYVMAFLIPFFIVVLICIGNGVYPFGDNCILHIDMYHQYCPFFTEFLNKLTSGGSLQYSWNLGLGSDFVSLYAYYLASPLNFLIVLCPKQFVIEFMTILVLVKIALCGLTFFCYVNYHFHLVGKDGRLHSNQVIPSLVFSTAYALSGFVAAYSWDIMWMDSILLFPLIMAGLEKLVREGKAALYFVTLALSIFANYYISIMICIFLVFDFLLLCSGQKEGKGKAILRFAWYSLLAGASSLILLLPEIAVLSASGSAEDGFPKTVEWYFSILAELGRTATMATSYTGNDHWPNLYAGAFTLILVGLYVLNRRIAWKEKIPRLLMLFFFLVSFAENQLDYIWHGMHFPQALPGRQSFLYIFMLLVMGFATIRKWKGTRRGDIVIATLFVLVLLLLAGYDGDDLVTEPMAIMITMLFVVVYGILLLLIKLARKKMRPALREFLFCIAIAELAINMAVTGLGVTSRVAYTEKVDYYADLLQQAADLNGTDGFYRVEDSGRKTKNDDSRYGYASATIFSSLMNLNISHLFQSFYMEGGKNFYCYNGATPLTSALFSVRYMLSSNPVDESPLRTLLGSSNGNYLYENTYCLPLGYVISEDAIKGWKSSMLDRLGSLNSFTRQLGAQGDLLCPATYTQDQNAGDSTLTVAEEGYYYADYVTCNADSLTVTRDDGWTQQYGKTTHRYLIDLGQCGANTQIHITNTDGETVEYHVYRLNMQALDTAYGTLADQTLTVDAMTDRTVQGHIDVKKAGRLVLSIPADRGWKLTVDGKEAEIEPFADALIGVHLEEGTHTIALCYTTPGLYAGMAGSLAAIALFLLSMGVRRWKKS